MATTAILRSRDCLLRHPNPRRRLRRLEANGRDRRCTAGVSSPPTKKNNNNNNNLVMGQVKILKRGETLPDLLRRTTAERGDDNGKKPAALRESGDGAKEDDLMLCSTGRLGPEPETVQKEIKVLDLYAGAALFVASPPPSSLPFPAFFTKKETKNDATSDLRRLLKLDLV